MLRQKAVSLTTWFKVPELGMSSFEILSQGSAVVVAMKKGSSPIFLAADRTARPFAMRHLFPQPFLDHVKPEHIKMSIETRAKEGSMVERFSVDLDSFLAHPNLDVAVMKLAKDDEEKFGRHNMFLPLTLSERLPHVEEMTSLIGHTMSEDDQYFDGKSIPTELESCSVVACEEGRGIVIVEEELPACMSGGAVVGVDGLEDACYGIIEGSLPLEEDDDINSEFFVHCATFTTSVEIRNWLSDPDTYTGKHIDPES